MAFDPSTGAFIPDGTQPTQPAAPTPAAPAPIYQAPNYQPGSNFEFDPNKYLPGIQQQASSIYDPQKANIEALAKISSNQNEQQRVTTKEDFAKRLTAEIEAINSRGAFFGGGALDRQSNINRDETRALENINLTQAAANATTSGQLGQIDVSKGQYVNDQLTGAKNSAYGMFQDSRNFYTQQQEIQREQTQWEKNYKLELKRIKILEKTNKKEAKRAKQTLNEQKRQFDSELKYKYSALSSKGNENNITDSDPTGWGKNN